MRLLELAPPFIRERFHSPPSELESLITPVLQSQEEMSEERVGVFSEEIVFLVHEEGKNAINYFENSLDDGQKQKLKAIFERGKVGETEFHIEDKCFTLSEILEPASA